LFEVWGKGGNQPLVAAEKLGFCKKGRDYGF
jgi:hypothetical protein